MVYGWLYGFTFPSLQVIGRGFQLTTRTEDCGCVSVLKANLRATSSPTTPARRRMWPAVGHQVLGNVGMDISMGPFLDVSKCWLGTFTGLPAILDREIHGFHWFPRNFPCHITSRKEALATPKRSEATAAFAPMGSRIPVLDTSGVGRWDTKRLLKWTKHEETRYLKTI